MKLRVLIREVKDFPGTTAFCLLWVVVFAAMVRTHHAAGAHASWTGLFVLGIGDGHRFGDLALQDLARGEYWRLMTSTFVHFSILHLVLNVIAMYQLGTMVESWYGTAQSVFIYGVTGAGGNLVSVIIRYMLGSNPRVHSGGGSVVIMGLVGLCAVVGLRSRSAIGLSMGRLMLFFMATTAVLGAALPRFIDNWGHAGGALVGIALGFANLGFLRAVNKPSAWGRGVVMGLVIAACTAAQALADRREAPLRHEQRLTRQVAELERDYQMLALVKRRVRQRADAKTIRKLLDRSSVDSTDDNNPAHAELRRLLAVARGAKEGPFSVDQIAQILERLTPLLRETYREFLTESKKLRQLRDNPRYPRPRYSAGGRI